MLCMKNIFVVQVRESALQVCIDLSDVLLTAYPGIRDTLRSEVGTILGDMASVAVSKLEEALIREQVWLH